jgi:hypothetical protein
MAKKVGSVYAEIRADIKKLQADFDKAHGITVQSAKKIQDTLDKGINFDKVSAAAVAAGASIYSAFRVIGQSIESARIGSVLEKQAVAFNNLSNAAGTSSKRMIDSLKASSQGLIAESDLMAAAGKAMLMNIPADKISELMKIAAATSKMTGQSITDAFNDITMGVARQSRMILDNLGIIVNVDAANAKYAKTLGVTADSLDDAQKRQAFMNAVLEAGADMIKRLGSSSGALDGVNKLIAAQSDLWADVNKVVAQFLDKELTGYAKVLVWIDEKLKSMGASAASGSRESMYKEIEMLRSLESKGMVNPGTTMNKMAEFNKRYGLNSESEISDSSINKKYRESERAKFYGAQRVSDNQIGYDVEGRWKIYEEGLKKLEEEIKKAEAEAKKFAEEIKKLDEEFQESKIFSGEGSNYERMEAQLRSSSEVTSMIAEKNIELEKQRAKIAELDELANQQRWFETYVQGVEDATRANEIFNDTMNIMSQNMSDAFSKLVTGSLSFKDAFLQMTQSIIASMTRMASQKAFEQMFGLIAQGIGSFAGGGETPTGMGTNTSFGSGGTMGGFMGMVKHGGGTVGSSGGSMRSIPASYFSSAPRYHAGLFPDEQAAILQKGETVIPKGGMAGGDTYNVYQITATDTQSFIDACRRSGAVPMLAAEAINQNGGLRKTIMSRAK